jgi:hypothetical protein
MRHGALVVILMVVGGVVSARPALGQQKPFTAEQV